VFRTWELNWVRCVGDVSDLRICQGVALWISEDVELLDTSQRVGSDRTRAGSDRGFRWGTPPACTGTWRRCRCMGLRPDRGRLPRTALRTPKDRRVDLTQIQAGLAATADGGAGDDGMTLLAAEQHAAAELLSQGQRQRVVIVVRVRNEDLPDPPAYGKLPQSVNEGAQAFVRYR
jgi:hypothetical protein